MLGPYSWGVITLSGITYLKYIYIYVILGKHKIIRIFCGFSKNPKVFFFIPKSVLLPCLQSCRLPFSLVPLTSPVSHY